MMPIENDRRVYGRAADRRRGMTFGELRRFVQDGMHADIPDDAPVKVNSTWRATIRSLELRARVTEAPSADDRA